MELHLFFLVFIPFKQEIQKAILNLYYPHN